MSWLKRIKGAGGQQTNGLFADASAPEAASAAPTSGPARKGLSLSNLFRKRESASPQKSGSIESGSAELCADESGQVLVAFGVRWRTLIKAGGREAAVQLATKGKATHFIHVGHQVGYTKIKKGIDHPTYPAALLIAKASSGTGVYSLTLAEAAGRYWFATARDGMPAGVDEVVSGLSEPDAVARIRQLVQAMEGEGVAVYTDIRQTGIAGQRSFSLHDVFDVVRSEGDRLSKVSRGSSSAPKPLVIGTMIAVALLVSQKGWNYYSAYKRQQTLEANRVVDLTPEEAWAPVVAKFEQSTTDASPEGFLAARASLSQLPVLWAGWKLTAARCQAGDVLQDKRPWACQATYERTGVAIPANQMIEKIKQRSTSFALTLPTSSTLSTTWGFSEQVKTIKLGTLRDRDEIAVSVISAIQGYFPVLALKPEFKMVDLPLPEPKKQDGSPQPRPADVPPVFRGDLVLKAPLRSVDAMVQRVQHVSWDAVGLQVDAFTKSDQKGLTASSMLVEVTGKAIGRK